jgi:hypothetical protein
MTNSPYDPRMVDVVAVNGRPVQVKTGHGFSHVTRICNTWRIDEDWWRDPIERTYFLLELENGSQVSIFRDGISGAWYRQHFVTTGKDHVR